MVSLYRAYNDDGSDLYLCLCRVRGKFFPLVESGLYSWDDKEQRELLRSILMTTCDIATISKVWEIQRRVSEIHDFFPVKK